MNSGCRFVIGAATLLLFAYVASAQDVSRYRGYVLESSVESVVGTSGARAADAKTIHERPAKIQELEWRAPYVSSGSELADPVRGIVFTFLNDALYQVVVNYDRERTDGLTNNDIIDTLTAAYGAPVLRSATQQPTRPVAAQPDTVALAQWETAQALLTLVRGTYTPEFQLILISKPLASSLGTRLERLSGWMRPRRRGANWISARKKPQRRARLAKKRGRRTRPHFARSDSPPHTSQRLTWL